MRKWEVSSMLPIGPLMVEHRIIERLIRTLGIRMERLWAEKEADPGFIEAVVHFFRAYADRCHHGKEEDILFRALSRKDLSPGHVRLLAELTEEHKQGRRAVTALADANQAFLRGEPGAVSAVVEGLGWFVDFYPRHIEKEDKRFFIPVMDYFTRGEKDAMIAQGDALDSRLLHQEFEDLVRSVGPAKK
jgi:hemerythrin-like domain-containing protein